MNNCEKFIKHIIQMREKLENNRYSSGEELEFDFNEINKITGIQTNDVKYENLKDIFNIQQLLIHEVCKIHESENDLYNAKLFSEIINIKEINKSLKDGKRAFNIYSFNEMGYDYFFVGDLHSDAITLKRILNICKFFEAIVRKRKIRLIFLGDYVDRGKAHIKTLEYILALKYLFPNYIYLLKGNHDDGYLFEDEVKLPLKKPWHESDDNYFLLYLDNLLKDDNKLRNSVINSYLAFFNSLCKIGFITNQGFTILALHGGIPRPRKDEEKYYSYINSISDLTNTDITDCLSRTIVDNILWSDPCNDNDDLRENSARFRFTVDHFEEFQEYINFDLVIRGHEAEKNGYKNFFNNRLFTIFSSGVVLENDANINTETAYDYIAPKIIEFSEKGNISLLQLNG